MSLRFGDKTRAGEGVSGFGKRASSGPTVVNVYEQEFLAPGTWTCPPTVTFVDVLVVGGGQGGFITPAAGGGSGGGVAIFQVPVSGPMPVTIGAGGTSPGGIGGTTWFGPSAPPAPNDIARAKGGGDTGLYGGSAQGMPSQSSFSTFGSYGYYTPTVPYSGGAGGVLTGGQLMGGVSKWGYGGGAGASGQSVAGTDALANTGHGGADNTTAGQTGGSGYCLVRWYAP